MVNLDIKSYNIKYYFETKQGKIESNLTVFACNKEEVDIIMNNKYSRIVKGGHWKIDGVFVKSEQFQNENGKFKYIEAI